MSRRALTLLAIAACGGHGAGAPDGGGDAAAPVMTITGRELLRDVRCVDATHVPSTVESAMPALAVSSLDADGVATDLAVGGDGSFSFAAVPGAPYRLAVSSGLDAQLTEYQLAAPSLDLAPALIGHYPRSVAPPGTTLTAAVTGAPTTGVAVIASVGLWAQVARTSGTNAAFTVGWSQAGSISGAMGLVDASEFDRMYWTDLELIASPRYYATTSARSEDFTMMAGTANTLRCTAVAVPFDRCVHLVAHADAETQRLAAAAPASYATPFWRWVVSAVPAPAVGPIGGLTLAYYTYTSGDLDTRITYGVPFPGHDVALAMQHLRSRTVTLPGAAGLPIYASTQHVMKPAADCTAATELAGTVAIPGPAALDGITLASDGIELSLDRTRQHVVTWDIASPGTHSYWAVHLYALAAPASQTTLALQRTWITDRPQIAIDPGVFVKASTYLFEVEAVAAYPNAAQGDFRTTGYPASPYAVSSIPGGTFVVND